MKFFFTKGKILIIEFFYTEINGLQLQVNMSFKIFMKPNKIEIVFN